MATRSAIDSLPADSVLVHERLWEATEGISGVLGWAEAASIWLVTRKQERQLLSFENL